MKKLNLADDSGEIDASSSSNVRQKRLLIILVVVLIIGGGVFAAQQFLFKEKGPALVPMRPPMTAIPPSPPASPAPSVTPSETVPPSPTAPPVSAPALAPPSSKAEQVTELPKPSKPRLQPSGEDRKTLPTHGYTLQVLSCVEEKNARESLQRLNAEGFSPEIIKTKATLTKRSLYLGDFSSPEEAASLDARLKEDGISAVLHMAGEGRYSYLISSYFTLSEAIDASHELEKKGYPVRIRETTAQTSVYQVRMGHFANRGQAAEPIQRLRDLGYSPVVVRE